MLGAVLHPQRADGRVRVVPALHPRPVGGAVSVVGLRVVHHQPHHLHRLQPHVQARLHPAAAVQVQTTGRPGEAELQPLQLAVRRSDHGRVAGRCRNRPGRFIQ